MSASSLSGARGSQVLSAGMEVGLLPWQFDVWQQPERFQVVTAGRRSGKSELMFKWVTLETLDHPSASTGWIVGPSLTHLREIIWGRYVDWLKSQPVKVLVDKNETSMTVTLPKGKRVTLKGLEEPDKLLGKGLACLGMTEAAICPGVAWEKVLRPMLSDTMGRAMFESTPRGRNWFYRLARMGGLPEEHSPSLRHKDWCFSRIKTEDVTDANGVHIVDLEEIASYRSGPNAMDPDTFLQEWEAVFLGYTGLLIPEFYLRSWVDGGNLMPLGRFREWLPRTVSLRGLDWGMGSQTVSLMAAVDSYGRVVFYDEYAAAGKNVADLSMDILSRKPFEAEVTATIGDKMMWRREYDGNQIAEQFRKHGLPMQPSDSRFEDSISRIRAMCQSRPNLSDPFSPMPQFMVLDRKSVV